MGQRVAGKKSQFWSLRFDSCLCGWAAAKAEDPILTIPRTTQRAVKSDGAFSFVFVKAEPEILPFPQRIFLNGFVIVWRRRVSHLFLSPLCSSLLSNVQLAGEKTAGDGIRIPETGITIGTKFEKCGRNSSNGKSGPVVPVMRLNRALRSAFTTLYSPASRKLAYERLPER